MDPAFISKGWLKLSNTVLEIQRLGQRAPLFLEAVGTYKPYKWSAYQRSLNFILELPRSNARCCEYGCSIPMPVKSGR